VHRRPHGTGRDAAVTGEPPMPTAILVDNHAEDGGAVAVEIEHADDSQVFVGLTNSIADYLLTLDHGAALDLAERLIAAVRTNT
jgi:hypothetical protein